jgi:hypothetical protein
MSCNNDNAYGNVCRQDIPYPQVSSESVPSLIDNLVYALYGTITKSVVANRVVWDIPCDPASNPAEVPGLPRMEGEGLLCYIMRAFVLFATEGFNINSPFLRWSFTGNGTTQSYNLPDAFGLLPNSYLVYIDGVVQDPVNFTISNTNPIAINFSTAIPNGSVVTIISLGGATPSTDVTDYTATPDNSSVSNTIGYWLAQSTFNQNSNYQVTGTPTARNLATRGGDVINVRDFGATGNGTTDDTAAIQAAITAAPAGSAIYFPRGTYRLSSIEITKDVSIYGDGKNATTLSLRNPTDFRVFWIKTSWISFEMFDLTMRDPHGFRILDNTTQYNTTGITNINRPTYTPYEFPLENFYVRNVDFIDFYDGIETSGLKADVSGCNFIYTYGSWSVGGNWDALNGGGDHPFVGMLCSFWNLNFTNNYYDGLLDSTFANVNPLTATYPLSKRGSDGMILAQSLRTPVTTLRYAETNGIKSVQTVTNNVCKNNAIEGIQFGVSIKNQTEENNYYINISNNEIIGVSKYYGTAPNQPANWSVGTLAILVGCTYFRPTINISENKIDNNITGIAVANNRPDDIPLSSFTGIWPLQGQTKITNNSISGCQSGISSNWNLPEDVISNNSIFCNSENAKTLFGNFSASVTGSKSTQGLIAINVVNGNPTVSYNNASANYSFEQTKTISGNSSNVLTLNNTNGMNDGLGSALFLYGGVAWWFPITNISGNNVTLQIDFWNSFNSYWSTRGGFNLNGVSFSWTPYAEGAVRTSFLWSVLNQGGGGNGWVTPSPLNKVYNNTASNFLRDFSVWNNSVTFEKQIYFSNMTSNNIYQKTYLIQFAGATSSNAILNGGFYLDI